uniref:Ovule protein n=1 Tax=Parascaris univalens TaxID=6257 RepID=A0A915BZ20_PARUN
MLIVISLFGSFSCGYSFFPLSLSGCSFIFHLKNSMWIIYISDNKICLLFSHRYGRQSRFALIA